MRNGGTLEKLRTDPLGVGSAVLIVLVLGVTAWFECRRLSQARTLAEAVLWLLLFCLPLACFVLFGRVRRTGRPATANLFLALTMFSALLCLAIAELRDPISSSLGSQLHGEEAAAGTEAASARTSVLPLSPNGAAAPVADSRRAPTKAGLLGSVSISSAASGTTPSPTSAAEIQPTPEHARDQKPISYSLYDMLSLIGMIATISVIVLGAMVTEETRKLERLGEQRRATMLALTRLNTAFHQFYQDLRAGRQIQMSALHVRVSAAEVELSIEDQGLLREFRQRLETTFGRLGVTRALTGDAVRGEDVPKPGTVADEIGALGEVAERHYRAIVAPR